MILNRSRSMKSKANCRSRRRAVSIAKCNSWLNITRLGRLVRPSWVARNSTRRSAFDFLRVWPGRTGDPEKLVFWLDHSDGCRGEFGTIHGRIADQLVKLLAGLGAHDCFIGCAEGSEHSRQAVLLFLGPSTIGLAFEH